LATIRPRPPAAQLNAGVSTIETEIKRNPIFAVLISLGIGLLVGMLNRKADRHDLAG
jgi:hypothetical protein